jgi:hypothetical protein
MSPWIANEVALALALLVLIVSALALLWRVGSWRISPAATLNLDEGLRIGSIAPELAVRAGEQDFHLASSGPTPSSHSAGRAADRAASC